MVGKTDWACLMGWTGGLARPMFVWWACTVGLYGRLSLWVLQPGTTVSERSSST